MKCPIVALALLLASPAIAQPPPAADAPAMGAIVQIVFTYADVPAKDLPRLGSLWAVAAPPDALGMAQALAMRRHVSMTLTPAQAVVTADGQTGELLSTKRIPYGGGHMYGYNFAVVSGVSATPRVGADGTITIHIILKQSGREHPRRRDGNEAVTTEMNVDTTRRFRSGDTELIAGPLPDISPPRFVFATVTLLPDAKNGTAKSGNPLP